MTEIGFIIYIIIQGCSSTKCVVGEAEICMATNKTYFTFAAKGSKGKENFLG
jgi:hypothetical protein